MFANHLSTYLNKVALSKKKDTGNPVRKWAKGMNIYFTKKEITRDRKHMKRCSTQLAREVQMKTTRKYYYAPIRMVKVKNCDNTKCW